MAQRYDSIIIGGGSAGLQAALTLLRVRRSVLLIDDAQPRHRFAKQMHNFIGADGAQPDAFYAQAHKQLSAYPHFTRVQNQVANAVKTADGFTVTDASGAHHEARTLLFACGVKDVLPRIEGIEALWGDRVLHCSYCHGYEARDQRIAVLSSPEHASAHIEAMLTLSNQLQFFFNVAPDAALAAWLEGLGVAVVIGQPVKAALDAQGLQLTLNTGEARMVDVLFVKPANEPNTRLPFRLGCQDAPGGFIAADAWGRTNVFGIYAAGDIAGGVPHQFASAVKSGMDAAVSIHVELTRAALA